MSESFGRYLLDETLVSDVFTSTMTGVARDGGEGEVRVRRATVTEKLPAQLLDRFTADAKAAAAITHENIVAVLDYGVEDGTPYIVLPTARTCTLRQVLAEEPSHRLGPDIVALIGTDVARGLEYAHGGNPPLIHRAISPDVLEIDPTGTVQIADYALHGLLTEASERVKALLEYTARYKSPDQAKRRPLTGATDVFSLGSTLYEALIGRPAFDAPTPLAIGLKVSMAAHERLDHAAPELPAPLRALVTQMLSLEPGARPSAGEVATRLEPMAAARDELARRIRAQLPAEATPFVSDPGYPPLTDDTLLDSTDHDIAAPEASDVVPLPEGDPTDPDRTSVTVERERPRSLAGPVYRPERPSHHYTPPAPPPLAPVPQNRRTVILVAITLGAIVLVAIVAVLTAWLAG